MQKGDSPLRLRITAAGFWGKDLAFSGFVQMKTEWLPFEQLRA
jgi:hypothetical protein